MIKGDKREGVFSLSSGKLYTKVKKLLAPDSKFEIHTPTAVAAVRGTEWISVVESNPGSTFYSLNDSITVFNPKFPKDVVTVKKGHYTVVEENDRPRIPVAFILPMIAPILNELGVVLEGAADAGAAGAEASVAGAGAGLAVFAGLKSGAAITAGGALAGAFGTILILTGGKSTTTIQHTATGH
ncbi:MAG: FecR family protein [Candidatus Mariimomonas ferrooxydans]